MVGFKVRLASLPDVLLMLPTKVISPFSDPVAWVSISTEVPLFRDVSISLWSHLPSCRWKCQWDLKSQRPPSPFGAEAMTVPVAFRICLPEVSMKPPFPPLGPPLSLDAASEGSGVIGPGNHLPTIATIKALAVMRHPLQLLPFVRWGVVPF